MNSASFNWIQHLCQILWQITRFLYIILDLMWPNITFIVFMLKSMPFLHSIDISNYWLKKHWKKLNIWCQAWSDTMDYCIQTYFNTIVWNKTLIVFCMFIYCMLYCCIIYTEKLRNIVIAHITIQINPGCNVVWKFLMLINVKSMKRII